MVLDMDGFDTQAYAMGAIEMLIGDYDAGFLSSVEFITAVKAVSTEWSI